MTATCELRFCGTGRRRGGTGVAASTARQAGHPPAARDAGDGCRAPGRRATAATRT